MPNSILAILAALLALAAALAVRTWLRLRGKRVVTCPENQALAGVELDARQAAFTGLYKAPHLRLQACSRWPEERGCGQECLRQIAAAPEECLVRHILARWYAGQSCTYCAAPFASLNWELRRPALLAPDGDLKQWTGIPAEDVFNVLETHKPVCFTCFTTNTFVRSHPHLVVDRSGLRR